METVNESAQDGRRTLAPFASGKPTQWRNRLIWGDKKYVLPSLLPEFAGKVNLIYIDPPVDTGADFSIAFRHSPGLLYRLPDASVPPPCGGEISTPARPEMPSDRLRAAS